MVSTARISILVNGNPCGFFQSSKGVIPFYFCYSYGGVELYGGGYYWRGFFNGFTVGINFSISHLLFADNTLFFCDAVSE